MIRIAPEGWPFLIPGLALTGLAIVGASLIPESSPFLATAATFLAWGFGVFTAFTAYFFRNPVRQRRDGDGLVLAPADGKVIQIEEVEEPLLFAGPARRISIFLNIFNVHIQRAPVSGRVAFSSYQPGRFAVAWAPKASEDNEQSTLGLVSGTHKLMVRQIAGLVARRIVTDPKEGQLVPQGSRIGIIRFGSRVDLFLPLDWELSCKVGDGVKGGLTTMARVPRDKGG